ncbi:MAG TPA: HDOD domain-containing protein, partial [Accumulibacter sp.]
MPTAEQLVASSVTLVTLPEVFARVKQVVDDPRATTIDLARVISADPGVSARILKLINSAFWGFSGRIDS